MTALLRTSALVKTYGAVTAVDGLDLPVEAGRRHAVIGPNGAGKSTLLGLLAGTITPTSGRVVFDGADITRTGPERRSILGIARTFQQPSVAVSLTVAENVALGAWKHADKGRRRGRKARLVAQALDWLDAVGLAGVAERPVGSLPYGSRRLLEVAMALAARPKLLLLDEPAAGIGDHDTALLVKAIEALPEGVATVFVEHDFEVVAKLADTVTVLHGGRLLASGTPAQIAADQAVRDAYLGDDVSVERAL